MRRRKTLDFLRTWNMQGVNPTLNNVLTIFSQAVNEDIIRPPQGISNISEWWKKDACWTRLQSRIEDIEKLLPSEFDDLLLSLEDQASEVKTAKQTQKVDNGIEAQRRVLAIPATQWARLQQALSVKHLLTPKEIGILNIAMQMPAKIPSERQCAVLMDAIEKGRSEGVIIN